MGHRRWDPELLRRRERAEYDPVPVSVDRLRGELYQILDQLPRATREAYPQLVRDFERGWEAFKRCTARRP
jgi:hypothetical protein